jgi:methylase of polypeptide subunit release factors
MSEFIGAAPYYQTYRPGIPNEVTKVLVDAASKNGKAETLLDLGTGTGMVVQALHPYFTSIVAIDPDETLLAEAAASLSQVEGLKLACARPEDFRPDDGWWHRW